MKRLTKALLTLLLFLGTTTVSAQSFYELEFKDLYGNEYTAFWVYKSESESYMRVAYFNADKYRVVNVEYTAETGQTEDGIYYFVLLGENPSFITEAGDNEEYNPDFFFWTRYENEEYGLPMVTSDPDFGEDSFVQVDSYEELSPSDFTEEYLNQFYATDEADFIALMSMVNSDGDYTYSGGDSDYGNYSGNSDSNDGEIVYYNNGNGDTQWDSQYDKYGEVVDVNGGSGNSNTNTTNTNNNNTSGGQGGKVTFHLIIAANTKIGDIGTSCDVDKRNLLSEFEGISEVMNMDLKKYIIDDRNFTKEYLLTTLNSCRPGSNDVVMFVYTGHGFRWSDQTGNYPQLDMRYNPYTSITKETSINLEEVYDIITAKGARLNIILGDCCNSDVGVNQRTSNTFLASRNDANFNRKNLDKLFFESDGNILATAASPGQVSWSNSVNGGFFLSSFFQAFREEIGFLDTDPNWNDMLANTIKYAEYKSSKAACSNCTQQNGQKSVSVTY